MLQQLSITNYALIDNLQISFDAGLNILTGETGAGKSIILGALSLILGQRAESRYFFIRVVIHDHQPVLMVQSLQVTCLFVALLVAA